MSNQELFAQGGAGLVSQPMAYDRYNDSLHEIAPTVQAANTGRVNGVVQPMAFAFDSLSSNSMKSSNPISGCNEVEISKTLDTTDPNPSKNQGGMAVVQNYAVRRLTPIEAERLQGFPDTYTAIPWRGKDASQCPDGPRYKALGNSMAVPVMRWIGERIQAVEELMKEIKQ